MSCSTNNSIFSKVNYDRIVSWDNKNEKCMSIGYDNLLYSRNNDPSENTVEIKQISCNSIKPNSKLIVYKYKNASNDIIPCPLGGWCNNVNNQSKLLSSIIDNQITNDIKLTTIDGTTEMNMSQLCMDNNKSLQYFNNSLNPEFNDYDAIDRENTFIDDLCADEMAAGNKNNVTCVKDNLSLPLEQQLQPMKCPDNRTIQTYQLVDDGAALQCPIGFCDNVVNRNNLKDYLRNLRSTDPRCEIPNTSNNPSPSQPSSGEPPQGEPPQGEPPQGEPPQGEPPQGEPPQGEPPQGEPPQGEPSPSEQFSVTCKIGDNEKFITAYKIVENDVTIVCPVGDYCSKEHNKNLLKDAIDPLTNMVINTDVKLIPQGITELDENNLINICDLPAQ